VRTDTILGALIVALGVAVAGMAIGHGFASARLDDRSVTVKGISEREVKADLAIWPLRVVASNDDLARAQSTIQSSVSEITKFLERHKIDTSQMVLQDFSVADAFTNQYASNQRVASRFVINQTVVVRSNEPEKILAASQRIGELVSAGVVLSSGGEYGSGGPTFIFMGLNKLKPEMIGESTARAREAAQKFAADSQASLGGIKHANQGLFEILPRDQATGITEGSQINKTVRVVSTVDYFLH
jgi:hypothetical protein